MSNNETPDTVSRLGDAGGATPRQTPFSVPAISLPKGDGAIRGITEKFAANPVTGTGLMTVPVVTSPYRAAFGLRLNLPYDSGTGNGSFRFGWSFSLPCMTHNPTGLWRVNASVGSLDKEELDSVSMLMKHRISP